jgi:predicted amidohydrolase YtcJ
VLPQQPAFLPSSDHHNAWVNSAALQLCGIDEHTPDPPDGWIERDASGRPTGTLREAAMALVGDRVTTSAAEYYEALLEAQQYLWSVGITGWHDALVGGYAGIDDPTPAYLRAIAAGTLRSHVRGSLWWDRHRSRTDAEIAAQAEELVVRRHELHEAGLDAGSVKIMVDGIAETFTATVGTGYSGLAVACPCGDHGLPFLSREALQATAVAVDRAGLQLHFHAIGDQAVHDALDAVEAARRCNGMNDRRHHIAHLQLVRPEDRPRFRRLGVVANLEGMWASADDPAVQSMVPHLPREQTAWHYPFADIVAAGGAVSGGSDWPVNRPDPVSALHVLVNRRSWSGSADRPVPLLPEQALTLETAFGAYTSGSAYVNHRPQAGAVQVGSVADLVVLDRDPFRGKDDDIGASRVASTWIAGAQVH